MALTQISTAGVKDDAVTSGKIPANAVGSSELADNAVDTAAIADNAVTAAKIADSTITNTQIAANAIGTGRISDDAITAAKLADNAVDTAAIAADAVTGAKIADDAINSEHYTDGSIDTAHIADSQVTTAKIANDAINRDKIADDVIASEHFIAGEVDANALASNSVTTAKIADDAVTAAKIADGTIVAANIANDTITAVQLANNSADINVIVDGAVSTAKIADSAVTDAKIASGISASKITGLATDSITEGNSTAEVLDTGSNGIFRFLPEGTEKFRIDTDGKVGIGVSFPSRTIDAHVTDSGANYLHLTNSSTGTGDGNGTFIGLDSDEGALIWNQENNYVRFGTNNSERMRIDSSGHVTTPSQPFFWAYNSSDYSWNGSTISFETEANDQGGNYNNSTYTFTCPVAGVYMFVVYMRTGGTFSEFSWTLQKNGGNFIRIIGQDSFAGNDCSFGQTIQNCSANDTWRVHGSGNHGGATGGYPYNGFQGYLLG